MGDDVYTPWPHTGLNQMPKKKVLAFLLLAAIVLMAAFSFTLHRVDDASQSDEIASVTKPRLGHSASFDTNDSKISAPPKSAPASSRNMSASSHGTGMRGGQIQNEFSPAALIRGNSLNSTAADALIKGENFDEALSALSRQSDAQALERSNRYRKELSENLDLANEGLAIRDLACGGSICMASIQDTGDHSLSLMTATTSMPEDLPMSSAIFHTISDPLRPNASIQRVIFSNNPQIRSITVPR